MSRIRSTVHGLLPSDVSVLSKLATHADPHDDGAACPGVEEIAEFTSLTTQTVSEALARLEDRGLVVSGRAKNHPRLSQTIRHHLVKYYALQREAIESMSYPKPFGVTDRPYPKRTAVLTPGRPLVHLQVEGTKRSEGTKREEGAEGTRDLSPQKTSSSLSTQPGGPSPQSESTTTVFEIREARRLLDEIAVAAGHDVAGRAKCSDAALHQLHADARRACGDEWEWGLRARVKYFYAIDDDWLVQQHYPLGQALEKITQPEIIEVDCMPYIQSGVRFLGWQRRCGSIVIESRETAKDAWTDEPLTADQAQERMKAVTAERRAADAERQQAEALSSSADRAAAVSQILAMLRGQEPAQCVVEVSDGVQAAADQQRFLEAV